MRLLLIPLILLLLGWSLAQFGKVWMRTRALSGRWSVRINGRPAPLIGKICMDLCVADVTGIPCAPGDDVVVFGPDNSAEAMADRLGTIHYELLCSVKNRVPRRYI